MNDEQRSFTVTVASADRLKYSMEAAGVTQSMFDEAMQNPSTTITDEAGQVYQLSDLASASFPLTFHLVVSQAPSTTTTTTADVCKPCDDGKETLTQASRNVTIAEQDLTRQKRNVKDLERELEKETEKLAEEAATLAPLTAKKEAVEEEWSPKRVSCGKIFTKYEEGLSSHTLTCKPRHYPASCEKECTETLARQNGCGVVEGYSPDMGFAVGGVEVRCKPPAASWIMSQPGSVESEEQQCKRLTARQTPVHAQRIVKKGWLLKRGRDFGWDRRFLVLESGDAVRSAVLRYFSADPEVNSTYQEWKEIQRGEKGIILWDAMKVKAKDAKDYAFEDGSQCFKIYHFYRSYRFCVESDGMDGRAAAAMRDQWVRVIGDTITFPTLEGDGKPFFFR